jgi:aldehyde:ferredoxin oxidoreductase
MPDYGYAGQVLKVDLTAGASSKVPDGEYTRRFIGGRGLAAKLFWEMAPEDTDAMAPENCLVCSTGPTTGFFGFAGCRWTMCAKTALRCPGFFSYGNLGGRWGPFLKSAGYDALAVTGKADRPVYLYLHDGIVETRNAAALWGLTAFDTGETIRAELGKGVAVLAIGPAAEHRVAFATALADGGASISGGMGAVMGSKNLKAVAVAGREKPTAAHPERLQQLIERMKQMRGTVFTGPSPWGVPGITVKENCYGCGIGCNRQSYVAEKGLRYKSFCQAQGVYTRAAMEYYGAGNHDVRLKAIRLCDGFGLDTIVLMPMMLWLMDCYREGLLNERDAGIPFSSFGSLEFIETLINRIAYREGFGDVLAQGTSVAAGILGEKAVRILERYVATPSNETKDYDPRLILTTALFYATEPRRPVSQLHAVAGNTIMNWCNWMRGKGGFLTTDDVRELAARFWGGPPAGDFSTFNGKALAAKTVQDRAYVQESLVLCDVHWPMNLTFADYPGGHVGDPGMESQIYSAITGRETQEAELYRAGERIANLQRAILLGQGWGGRKGDRLLDYFFREPLKKGEVFYNPEALMPGPEGKIISRVDAVINPGEFEKVKSEYYALRGWNTQNGFPTRARLEQLGLPEVMERLDGKGLLG